MMLSEKGNCINSMIHYVRHKDQEVYNIRLAQQNLVMERFEKTRDNPDRFLGWDEAKESLKN